MSTPKKEPTQPTPGPWEVSGPFVRATFKVKRVGKPDICNLYKDGVPADEVKANADLIAAAPVLLAALREVYRVTSYCFSPTSRDIYAATLAEQAIKAATGSKPTIEEPPDDQKFETLIKAYQK
jgi:hypothetical protein